MVPSGRCCVAKWTFMQKCTAERVKNQMPARPTYRLIDCPLSSIFCAPGRYAWVCLVSYKSGELCSLWHTHVPLGHKKTENAENQHDLFPRQSIFQACAKHLTIWLYAHVRKQPTYLGGIVSTGDSIQCNMTWQRGMPSVYFSNWPRNRVDRSLLHAEKRKRKWDNSLEVSGITHQWFRWFSVHPRAMSFVGAQAHLFCLLSFIVCFFY